MVEYPLLHAFRPEASFAWRGGEPITVETFLKDVAALAAVLPERGHVVNLCRDRYRFAVGFAAALCRRQVTLLPPNETSAMLDRLSGGYGGVYCLTDAIGPEGPVVFHYPSDLTSDPAEQTIPRFPADQPAVVLFTSGSTGRPQPHGRTWGELVSSTLAAGRRLGIASLEAASLLGTVPHQH